ncbi:WYL domain-containing protein [Gryllotalpicola daejeonensis]|uniref:WYL domain-containing protein n=1 Tax=Gryllotalpicola daejeonensis TaxID=993087 RepID=A0ABP7ZN09_9MICO
MTRPTARVLALLELLQRGGTHTAAQLAAELAVDERTVRRYVEHLVELEIPVQSARGRYGGYRLAPGERMPPLMLTDDEALAVMLGLVAARRSGLVTAASAAESAGAKVRASLPTHSARRLEAVLEGAAFTASDVSTAPSSPGVGVETRTLLQLATAARERRPLWFRYVSRDGGASDRTLLPYGLVAHAGHWYATGHDSRSGQVRTFRVDRISDPSLLPGGFEPPEGFDPMATVLHSLATTPWAHEVSVLVRGTADELRTALRPGLATIEDATIEVPATEAPATKVPPTQTAAGPRDGAHDGEPAHDLADNRDASWTRVRLRAEQLDWVAALFAGLNRDFAVESPDELRTELRRLADRLQTAAAGALDADLS